MGRNRATTAAFLLLLVAFHGTAVEEACLAGDGVLASPCARTDDEGLLLQLSAAVESLTLRGEAGQLWANPTAAMLASAAREQQKGADMAAHALSSAPRSSAAEGRDGSRLMTISLNSTANAPAGAMSFQSFYESHNSGRGIWKWSNSLEVYQRHFAGFADYPVSVAEVGVQSGGSILMWQAVLGAQCHVFGLDINKACTAFTDGQTTITIGDQGDPAMWAGFFEGRSSGQEPKLDILVDDGGHEPRQMLTTLTEVFSRLQPGGFIAIEDIHGQHYIEDFFVPAATYLAERAEAGQLTSVHVYPFMLMVHKAGRSNLPVAELSFDPNRFVVNGFAPLWEEVAKRPGSAVVLQEPSWGPFLTAKGLHNFFAHFGGLHDFQMYATPPGCETTASSYCRSSVQNSPTQALISGVHIYANYLVVEMPATPPVITAVRKGNEWLEYSS